MHKTNSLKVILEIENCDELLSEFYSYVIDKKNAHQQLNEIEEVVYLLVSMLLDSEMEGFIDLFHQQYSLRECVVVENSLRQFNLNKLADLFGEAKSIYLHGKTSISEEEYREIGVVISDEQQSRRFDEIGEIILAEDSEIYRLSEPLCTYIRANREVLQNSNIE